MLFNPNGGLSTTFLQFAAASFYYTTGFGFSLLTPNEKLEVYEPYTEIPEPYSDYLLTKLHTAKINLTQNIAQIRYLDYNDAVIIFPISNRDKNLGMVVAGPFSIKSADDETDSILGNAPTQPQDNPFEILMRKNIIDSVENLHKSGTQITGRESITEYMKYRNELPAIQQFQIQYLSNLLNLIMCSTYYDPTVISSLPVSNEPSYKPNRIVSNRIVHHSIDQEEKILQQILTSEDTFTKLATKHISKLSNLVAPPLADDPIRSEKNRFIVSATIVSRNAIKLGMPSDLAFTYSDHFINKIESCDTLQKIWDLMMSLFSFYREEVKKIKEKSYFSPSTNLLLFYIEDHIDTNLSLQEICKILSIDYKYASNAFKKDTGLGFNKFLTKQKMEVAKTDLATTEKSIQLISERIGYNSAYYFTRIFKSSFGISPSEYRKRLFK